MPMPPAAAPSLVLHQFNASHFNDKARWALAFKHLPHRRVTYLPGPHQGPIRKLSGQSSTPVLLVDRLVVAGSARIIDVLEERFPDRPLYPSDSAQRAEALALQKRFDTELGPATRTVVFSVLVKELGYLSRLFARGEPALKRGMYLALLPFVRGLIAKANGVADPANVKRSFDVTARTLDEIAERVLQRPYLLGDSFSVADLTAAALIAPIAVLQHPDMRQAPRVPASIAGLAARYAEHPAVRWTQRVYEAQRPADVIV